MVHGTTGRERETFGVVLGIVVMLGCAGQSRSDGTDVARGGASGGPDAGSGGGGALGGRSGSAGLGGEASQGGGQADDSFPLDASDCSSRPQADCTGVRNHFESNNAFAGVPALVECSQFNSFDGCGKLVFTFDSSGCATSVGPGPGGWEESGHLAALRTCLSRSFGSGRFLCLASSSLQYDESCFIR